MTLSTTEPTPSVPQVPGTESSLLSGVFHSVTTYSYANTDTLHATSLPTGSAIGSTQGASYGISWSAAPTSDSTTTSGRSISTQPVSPTPRPLVSPRPSSGSVSTAQHQAPTHPGAIAGGIIAAMIGIFCCFLLVRFLIRRRQKRIEQAQNEIDSSYAFTTCSTYTIPLIIPSMCT